MRNVYSRNEMFDHIRAEYDKPDDVNHNLPPGSTQRLRSKKVFELKLTHTTRQQIGEWLDMMNAGRCTMYSDVIAALLDQPELRDGAHADIVMQTLEREFDIKTPVAGGTASCTSTAYTARAFIITPCEKAPPGPQSAGDVAPPSDHEAANI